MTGQSLSHVIEHLKSLQPKDEQPTYSQELRRFVLSMDESKLAALQKLAAEQNAQERRWYEGTCRLREARAAAPMYEDYYRHVRKEMERFAEQQRAKLDKLGVPKFADAKNEKRVLNFLSDLVE